MELLNKGQNLSPKLCLQNFYGIKNRVKKVSGKNSTDWVEWIELPELRADCLLQRGSV